MIKLKLFVVLIVLVIICLSLCACTQKITMEFILDKNGQVNINYIVQYDKDSTSAPIVRAEVTRVFDIMTSSSEEKRFSYEIVDKSDGIIALYMLYPSLTDYYVANEVTGDEKNQRGDVERHIVYNKYISVSESYLESDNYENIKELLSPEYQDLELVGEFCYVYGTPYKSVKTNSDRLEVTDDIYYHTWNLEQGQPNQLVFTQTVASITFFFLLGIFIFVVGIVVMFVIIKIKNKKVREKFNI